MKALRLSKILELKYGAVTKTATQPIKEILDKAKDDILIGYQNWVMGKYRALKILAESGEIHAKSIYQLYNDLVANIDSYSTVQIFNRVNKILGFIHEMKKDSKIYRQSIHDMVEIKRESDKNYRERLKSGFETNLSGISHVLSGVAKVLKSFVPYEDIKGEGVSPQRKALSKEKLLMFMKSYAAKRFGLDNIEIMSQLLSYPETREKITTLINAVDRGHFPMDGPEVMQEALAIKQWLDNKKTNLLALEQESKNSPPSLFESDEDIEEDK